MSLIPNYYSPLAADPPELKRSWLTVALFFGLAPVVLGLPVLALWLLTQREWLIPVGVCVVMVGCLLSAMGGCALLLHVIVNWRRLNCRDFESRRDRGTAFFVGMLLLSSPFAALLIFLCQSIPNSRNTF